MEQLNTKKIPTYIIADLLLRDRENHNNHRVKCSIKLRNYPVPSIFFFDTKILFDLNNTPIDKS